MTWNRFKCWLFGCRLLFINGDHGCSRCDRNTYDNYLPGYLLGVKATVVSAWFLKRVFWVWLILTVCIIAGVLEHIAKTGGFNAGN